MDDENKEKILNNLSQQLSEVELLKSMYPHNNELNVTDETLLNEIRNFVDNFKVDSTPRQLDLTLNISIDNLKLEILINLPTFYPTEEPNVCVRCDQLNRHGESNFNKELKQFIKDSHIGEVCLHTVISWIQDSINKYNNKVDNVFINFEKDVSSKCLNDKFGRFWILSHHIYNKKKREEIVNLARKYNLNGFCLPGKPGVICVEGLESDCNEWWRIIKSWNWKKITLKIIESFDMNRKENEQKFDIFEELKFINTCNNGKHSNMSEFSKYLNKNNLTESFNELFGFCN